MDDFAGRKAVVTGATRGIGKAVTCSLLESGATVIGLYAGNLEAADMLIQETGEYDGRLVLYQCDVADVDAVATVFKEIEEDFDTIDILVSNAGIRRDGVLAMMQPEDWHRVIDVNLNGSYHVAKYSVMLMVKQKYGRIIFITSPVSHLGFAGQANYAASKAGQIGLMKSLSKETAKRKITVNCVSPGFIETDFISDLSVEQLKEYKKLVPMRRFGLAEEVAHAVLFLAGDRASYITGSILEVDGGL